ncbi:helix-turn-helix domain-containing protein [Paraburkholderia sp. D1E]|uniref:helix-turn-helix domain-containing protein n=1 Tax=Paraburkholderia sp. D1E TaxID=3461398 RepID=UPI004045A936
MSLGKTIRTARKRAGMSLRDLESATGISLSKLSKVENEKATLRHPEVISLSEVLNIPAAFLLNADDRQDTRPLGRRAITPAGTGPTFSKDGKLFEVLCGDMSEKANLFWRVLVTEKAPGTASSYLSHPGEEFIFVLKGPVALHTNLYEPLVLQTGDCILFDASTLHAYFAVRKDAVILMSNSTESPH